MGHSYRTLRVEPTFRLFTADGDNVHPFLPAGQSRGKLQGNRIVRLESSFRVISDEDQELDPHARTRPFADASPVLAQESRAAGAELFEEVVHKGPDALIMMGPDGKILFANSTCTSLLGYQPEELTGEPIERLVPEEARAAHPGHRTGFHVTRSARPMANVTKVNAVHKDGSLVPVDVAVSPLDGDAANPIYIVSVRDATAQRALVSNLEALATTDPLTGVANRRSFEAAGDREFERFHRHGSSLSVMIIDVDHFKRINDAYGHRLGDEALIRLAATCLTKLRRTDMLARIGGEEFAILTPGSKTAEAMILADRVREAIQKLEIHCDGGIVQFTVSIGLAEAGAGDTSIAAALERADQALYEAKRNGRNQTVKATPPPRIADPDNKWL